MAEKPTLVLPPRIKGEPYSYACSQCGQPFLLPEDRTPEQGMAELWAAFQQHVKTEHAERADNQKRSGQAASEKA